MTGEEKTTPREVHLEKSISRRRLITNNETSQQQQQAAHTKSSETMPNTDEVAWRLRLSSSDCFEKIMGDIEGKMVEKLKQQHELTKMRSQNESETDAIEEPPPVILLELDDDEDEEMEGTSKDQGKGINLSPIRLKARRAWALIRRHIREEAMNKKQNKSNLQWGMLQQTLKNMKNMDAARGDLYNKYLNPSNPRGWTEGIKSIPPGFFAKHSKDFMRTSSNVKSKIQSSVSEKKFSKRR